MSSLKLAFVSSIFFSSIRSNWRRTYKSLLLLDYLLKNGSERVVTSAREHVYDLRSMENYAFVDENGEAKLFAWHFCFPFFLAFFWL